SEHDVAGRAVTERVLGELTRYLDVLVETALQVGGEVRCGVAERDRRQAEQRLAGVAAELACDAVQSREPELVLAALPDVDGRRRTLDVVIEIAVPCELGLRRR